MSQEPSHPAAAAKPLPALTKAALPVATIAAITAPYFTLSLEYRQALVAQAVAIFAAFLLALGAHLSGSDTRWRLPRLPFPMGFALGCYVGATVLGFTVALLRGNPTPQILGQTLSMGILPLAALTGACLPRTAPWITFPRVVWSCVALAVLIHGAQWIAAIQKGTPHLRLYLTNSVAVVGPALVALLFALAGRRERTPTLRRLATVAAILIGAYIFASGVRGLWLVTPPTLLLAFFLSGRKLRVRAWLKSFVILAVVGSITAGAVALAGWMWNRQDEPSVLGDRRPAERLTRLPVEGLEFVRAPLPGHFLRRVVYWEGREGERIDRPLHPRIQVASPRLFRLVAMLRGAGEGEGWIRVVWSDPEGTPLGELVAKAPPTLGWHRIQVLGMTPKDASHAQAFFGADPDGDSSWALDDMWLETPTESRAGLFFQQAWYFAARIRSTVALITGSQARQLQSRFRVQESETLLDAYDEAAWPQKLFGHGLGATFVMEPWHRSYDHTGLDPDNLNYIHNFYLFLLYKLGIVGTLLGLTALLFWLPWQIQALRRRPPGMDRDLQTAAVSGWLGYCAWAITSPEILDFRVAPLWGLTFAMAAALGRSATATAEGELRLFAGFGHRLRQALSWLEATFPTSEGRPLVAATFLFLSVPYLTIPFEHRTGLQVQAVVVLLATGWVFFFGTRKSRLRELARPAPSALRSTLLLYGGAALLGTLVGLLRGNALHQVAGQLLSMALLPVAAAAGLGFGHAGAWSRFRNTIWMVVGGLGAAHLLHWLFLAASGKPHLRLYFEDGASAVGPALLALVLTLACLPPLRGLRRWFALGAAAAIGLYILGSGVRGLWVAAPPTLLLYALLSRNLGWLRSRALWATAALTLVLGSTALWANREWLAPQRPNLLPSSSPPKLAGPQPRDYRLERDPRPGADRYRIATWERKDLYRSFLFSDPLPLEPGFYRLTAKVRGGEAGYGIVALHWLDRHEQLRGALRVRTLTVDDWTSITALGVAPTGTASSRLALGTTTEAEGVWQLDEVKVERLCGPYLGTILQQFHYLSGRLLSISDPVSSGTPDMHRSVAFRLRETEALLTNYGQAPWWIRLFGHGLGATFRIDPAGLDLWDERIDPESLHYIHNFYAFLLYKLGVFGGLLVLVALVAWLPWVRERILSLPPGQRRNQLAAVASAWVGYCLWSVSSPEILNFRLAPLWGLLLAMTAFIVNSSGEQARAGAPRSLPGPANSDGLDERGRGEAT